MGGLVTAIVDAIAAANKNDAATFQATAAAIQAIAAAVQAAAAAVTLLLTGFLIWLTAKTTRSAAQQVAEAMRARESGIRPYIHVRSAFIVEEIGVPVSQITVVVKIANIGVGPALGVRCDLSHPKITFAWTGYYDEANSERMGYRSREPITRPMLLESQGAELEVVFQPTASRLPEQGQIGDVLLRVQYRDLVEHTWLTRTPIVVGDSTAAGKQRFHVVTVRDEAEEVRVIAAPVLHRDRPPDPPRPPSA